MMHTHGKQTNLLGAGFELRSSANSALVFFGGEALGGGDGTPCILGGILEGRARPRCVFWAMRSPDGQGGEDGFGGAQLWASLRCVGRHTFQVEPGLVRGPDCTANGLMEDECFSDALR